MTVAALIKKLEKIQKECGPRTVVTVDLTEFRLVDESFSNWEIHDVDTAFIPWEKNGSRELANGEERMRLVVAIV